MSVGGALGGRMALVKVFGSHGGAGGFFFREGFNIRSKSFFCVVLFGRVLFYIWEKDLSVVIV